MREDVVRSSEHVSHLNKYSTNCTCTHTHTLSRIHITHREGEKKTVNQKLLSHHTSPTSIRSDAYCKPHIIRLYTL